jgi:MYND finger
VTNNKVKTVSVGQLPSQLPPCNDIGKVKEEQKMNVNAATGTVTNSAKVVPTQPQCIYDEHRKMYGRTTDPGLLDYDLAVEEFQQGVACARHGNYSRAQELIASAFLRNEKSIQHVEMLPSALLHDEYDGASIHVIEHSLFVRLLDHPHPEITVFLIMQICAGAVLGGHPEEGRRRVHLAIKSGEKLLQLYEKGHWSDDDFVPTNDINGTLAKNNGDMSTGFANSHYSLSVDEKKDDEDHFVEQQQQQQVAVASSKQRYSAVNLYGTLKRWRIHRQQSALHSVVGNFLMTYTELDNALQTAPVDHPEVSCQVMYDLATFCMSCQLKPLNECFTLLYQVVANAVIYNQLYDTPCLPLCYAYLAVIAAKNPATLPPNLIITHLDAFMLMEESDRCQRRYEELHFQPASSSTDGGKASNSPIKLDTNSLDRLKMKMEFLKLIGNHKQIRIWKLYDRQRSIVAAQHYERHLQEQEQKQQQPKEDTTTILDTDTDTTGNTGTKLKPNFAYSIMKNTWTAARSTRCLCCHKQVVQQQTTTTTSSTTDASSSSYQDQEQQASYGSLMKCTRCKNAFYCSKECQRKVRLIHVVLNFLFICVLELYFVFTFFLFSLLQTNCPQDWTIHKCYCKQLS